MTGDPSPEQVPKDQALLDQAAREAHELAEEMLESQRLYPPPPEFAARAHVSDDSIYEEAERDFEGFWAGHAEELDWSRKWDAVLDWKPPHAKWFVGGELNAAYNCVDRHVEAGRGERIAFWWEGEDGTQRTLTYAELLEQVSKFANALKELGVGKGDVVGIFIPMVLELPVAMLACARIGAIHNFVFGGFAVEAVAERLRVSKAKALVTVDGAFRRGKRLPVKQAVDEVIDTCPTVEHVIVIKRTGDEVPMTDGRDVWWHEVMARAETECPPEPLDSEHPLFILYTSGSTAAPKGILHTTGGYLTGVMATHRLTFDYKDDDVYWCTADCGWITGHSYIVYGPLANCASSLIYEGAPDFPDKDRWWKIVERYKVTILYTAPTAIRTFIKWGDEYPERHDLSSLRLLGSVGEPINPKAWLWYNETIGGGRCPIVDTWWQTETGMIMISPLPGVTATKPGSATRPLPGIKAAVFDNDGNEVIERVGQLVLLQPWPAMFRTLYGDPDLYVSNYWSAYGPDVYVTGDAARLDRDGCFWILGRTDDVINVSGHRLSTMEIESAIVSHDHVAEAAVVGQHDETTGEAIVAFVTPASGFDPPPGAEDELREYVAEKIGKLARPKRIIWTRDLPKTRSGKIMRRLLRDIAEGRELGDVTTLMDPALIEALREKLAVPRRSRRS